MIQKYHTLNILVSMFISYRTVKNVLITQKNLHCYNNKFVQLIKLFKPKL